MVVEDLLERRVPSNWSRGESLRPYSVRSAASASTAGSDTMSEYRTVEDRCETSMW